MHIKHIHGNSNILFNAIAFKYIYNYVREAAKKNNS